MPTFGFREPEINELCAFWPRVAEVGLEESLRRLPGTTCLVCEKFLERFADEARDIRTRRARDTFTLAKLVFRTYQQHQNDEWTCRSLTLIDHLCMEGIGDAGSHLNQFER